MALLGKGPAKESGEAGGEGSPSSPLHYWQLFPRHERPSRHALSEEQSPPNKDVSWQTPFTQEKLSAQTAWPKPPQATPLVPSAMRGTGFACVIEGRTKRPLHTALYPDHGSPNASSVKQKNAKGGFGEAFKHWEPALQGPWPAPPQKPPKPVSATQGGTGLSVIGKYASCTCNAQPDSISAGRTFPLFRQANSAETIAAFATFLQVQVHKHLLRSGRVASRCAQVSVQHTGCSRPALKRFPPNILLPDSQRSIVFRWKE